MRLQKVINSINTELAKKCYDNGEISACVDHVTKSGYIEVELTGDELTVTIFHNNYNDSECENKTIVNSDRTPTHLKKYRNCKLRTWES